MEGEDIDSDKEQVGVRQAGQGILDMEEHKGPSVETRDSWSGKTGGGEVMARSLDLTR